MANFLLHVAGIAFVFILGLRAPMMREIYKQERSTGGKRPRAALVAVVLALLPIGIAVQ